jgi:hypothetical protein
VIKQLDPKKPAVAIKVQDDDPQALDRTVNDALGRGLAGPDVSQVQIASVDLSVPCQAELYLIVTRSG